MAFCAVCGKGPRSGNNVSHANNRTKRVWRPNLQPARIVTENGTRTDHVDGREGRRAVTVVNTAWPQSICVRASEDTPLGRGARGAVPLHLNIESTDLALSPGATKSWVLQLRVEGS